VREGRNDVITHRVGVGAEVVGAEREVGDLETLGAVDVELRVDDTALLAGLHRAGLWERCNRVSATQGKERRGRDAHRGSLREKREGKRKRKRRVSFDWRKEIGWKEKATHATAWGEAERRGEKSRRGKKKGRKPVSFDEIKGNKEKDGP
jgi:hypothetical protein